MTFSEALNDTTIGTNEGTPASNFQVLIDNVVKASENEVAAAYA
ncbi:hypothetical protein ACFOU2_24610 [Bacillus songklensis]|uniref:Uncharacterized protein n=1 Tax=Bacillus songklensis TaxID=1069116 RepID=A0ABV8BB08_9BACI